MRPWEMELLFRRLASIHYRLFDDQNYIFNVSIIIPSPFKIKFTLLLCKANWLDQYRKWDFAVAKSQNRRVIDPRINKKPLKSKIHTAKRSKNKYQKGWHSLTIGFPSRVGGFSSDWLTMWREWRKSVVYNPHSSLRRTKRGLSYYFEFNVGSSISITGQNRWSPFPFRHSSDQSWVSFNNNELRYPIESSGGGRNGVPFT